MDTNPNSPQPKDLILHPEPSADRRALAAYDERKCRETAESMAALERVRVKYARTLTREEGEELLQAKNRLKLGAEPNRRKRIIEIYVELITRNDGS